MSRHNRDRRRAAADKLPPANRIPVDLSKISIKYVKEYHVGSWCPTSDGSGPAEAVVLNLVLATDFGDLNIGLRLKSPRAVDELIATLERHRNDVWPGAT